jgi:hypothetical protein
MPSGGGPVGCDAAGVSESNNNDDHYEDEDDDEEDDRKPAARGGADDLEVPPKKKRRRRRVISTLQESKWQAMYRRLMNYKERFGNVCTSMIHHKLFYDPERNTWQRTQLGRELACNM